MGKRNGLKKKVLEWAREYGKHFCVHDIAMFFTGVPEIAISGCLSKLRVQGYLVKSSNLETCKMSTKRHFFWIYAGKIAEEKAERKKYKRKPKANHNVAKPKTYKVLIVEMSFEDLKRLLD